MNTPPKNNSATHLNDLEMGCALVDRTALTQSRRRHLENCVHCQAELKRMAQELNTLGHLGQKMAVPAFSPTALFAKQTAETSRFRFPGLRPLATAAVLVLVIAIWWTGLIPNTRAPVIGTAPEIVAGLEILWQEIEQDQQLMAEIEALETTAEKWGLGEWRVDTQEESNDTFYEFIAPYEFVAPLEQEVVL